MSNIAEGFERGSKAELCRFLRIAKGSCGEVRSQLYVAQELEYIDRQEFMSAKTQAEALSKALSGFITYLVLGSITVRKQESVKVSKLDGGQNSIESSDER